MTLVSVPGCDDDCTYVTDRVVRRISDETFAGDANEKV